MTDFVERIATAIMAADGPAASYQDLARAALRAARKPTEAMVIAGCRHEHLGDQEGRWMAMVDEALRS